MCQVVLNVHGTVRMNIIRSEIYVLRWSDVMSTMLETIMYHIWLMERLELLQIMLEHVQRRQHVIMEHDHYEQRAVIVVSELLQVE